MSTITAPAWAEANQRYLMAALARVRGALERQAGRGSSGLAEVTGEELSWPRDELRPPALDRLGAIFGLSPFERDLLLLCAGPELEGGFAALCGAAQDDRTRDYPTFGLALATLPEAHWSALTPAAPLRHWRLIEVCPGNALASSPLRIDERILHELCGLSQLDERLAGLVEPLRAPADLVPSHRALAEQLERVWTRVQPGADLPSIQLVGDDPAARRAIAAAACERLGLAPWALPADLLPCGPTELDTLIRLWEREALLGRAALLLDCDRADPVEAGRAAALSRFVERLGSPLLVALRERRPFGQRRTVSLDVGRPTAAEQRAVWRRSLGPRAPSLNGQLDGLVAQFDLDVATIEAAGAEALGVGESERARERGSAGNSLALSLSRSLAPSSLGDLVWDACRRQARPRLDDLAQRIEPGADWDELVLPEPQRATLRDIAVHVRQRSTVYERWGFAARGRRGLGISALFSGPSGTGKTMAAEVLASELRLDLYRIDLAAVVSKYIGETEKNLRRVFDAAEEGGAILLFDEADALFGKRSEVKDSHDRYANIEVSYLLQRMEAYRGLAILTTNLKSALDQAFLRRIRFVVQFPFPDAGQRAEIWRRIFPPETPTEGLDPLRLARLNVAGGNIRNIALYAAFLAAEAGVPVRPAHLLRAARAEYAKLEKPLTDAESGGLA